MEEEKKTKKKKSSRNQWKKVLLQLGMGGLVGFVIGFILVGYTRKTGNELNFSQFFLLFVMLILAYFIQIIIHEGGHLLCGLLSGYHFLSFRIGSLTLVHLNGRWQWKRYSIQGTGGQCLMIPPEGTEQNCPYRLYNAGGILCNLIVSVIAAISFFMFQLSTVMAIFLIALFLCGIFDCLLNGIPMKIGGIANDGYNIFQLEKDPLAKKGWYIQLKTNSLISEGVRMRDLPLEWFEVEEDADFSNPIVAALRLQQGGWYLDKGDLYKAKECLESLIKPEIQLIDIYRKELKCELLFLEIVTTKDEAKIDQLYSKQLQAYIKATKYYVSRKRLLYAYYKIVKKDEEMAQKTMQEFEKVAKTYPILGEILMERDLIALVDQLASKELPQ